MVNIKRVSILKIKNKRNGGSIITLEPTECALLSNAKTNTIHFINRNEEQLLKDNYDKNSDDEFNAYKNLHNGKYTYEDGQQSFMIIFMLYKRFIVEREIEFGDLLEDFMLDVEEVQDSLYEDSDIINEVAEDLEIDLNECNEINQMITILEILTKRIKSVTCGDNNV